jgi:hypothetical protein
MVDTVHNVSCRFRDGSVLLLTMQEAIEFASAIQSAVAGARNAAIESHSSDANVLGFQSATKKTAVKCDASASKFVTVTVSSR